MTAALGLLRARRCSITEPRPDACMAAATLLRAPHTAATLHRAPHRSRLRWTDRAYGTGGSMT